MDIAGADAWVRKTVTPTGPSVVVHERPWATVLKVPVRDGQVWFKACACAQAFEARLTAELSSRWPDRVAEVLAHEEQRSWLLLADAGNQLWQLKNPPEAWLTLLPRYGELQRAEAAHASEHLAHHTPDLRLAVLPERFAALLERELPISAEEVQALRAFAPRLTALCAELAGYGIPDSVQHDDLHGRNVYVRGGVHRVLDWGDASISHPFASLVVTFRFLEELNALQPGDPWFARLRDAYLEPWGPGLSQACDLAVRIGAFAHIVAWLRQRDALSDAARREFDKGYPTVLRRAVALTQE
jgi:hypothetical protein